MRSGFPGMLILLVALAGAFMGCGPTEHILFDEDQAVLTGLIVNEEFQPVGQTTVSLEGQQIQSGGNAYSAYTEKDGTYEITGIVPNQYDVVARRDFGSSVKSARVRFIRLTGGMTLSMPDIQLKTPGSITGTVTTTGQLDHSNVHVEVVGTSKDAFTDASGTYTIPELEVGVYELYFSKDGWEGKTVRNVSVQTGTQTSVASVVLQPLSPSKTGNIVGKALLEAARNGDHSNIRVTVLGTSRSMVTSSDGSFVFANMPVGAYTLQFEADRYFTDTLSDVVIPAGTATVTVADRTITNHRKINASVKAYGIALSPSNSQIAYIDGNALDSNEIAVIDPTGKIFNQVLTSGARAAAGRGLCWNPNENEILYTKYVGHPINAYRLAVTDNTGSVCREISTSGTDYYYPTFSPDGDYVAYYLTTRLWHVETSHDSQGRLTLTTDTTTEIVDLAGSALEWTSMQWANTGRILYSVNLDILPESNVWTVLTNGVHPSIALNPKKFGAPTESVTAPIASPVFRNDWSKVAFSADDPSTDKGIWICDVDGFDAVKISEAPGKYLQWTNDRTKIIYVDADDNIAELLVPEL